MSVFNIVLGNAYFLKLIDDLSEFGANMTASRKRFAKVPHTKFGTKAVDFEVKPCFGKIF